MILWWVLVVLLGQAVAGAGKLKLQVEGHPNQKEIQVSGYTLQKSVNSGQSKLHVKIENRPGRYLNLEQCQESVAEEVWLSVLLKKGYRFSSRSSQRCYGYSLTDTASMKDRADANEIEQFNRELLSSGMLDHPNSQLKELLKLRLADTYTLQVSPQGDVLVNCIFAHHRPIGLTHLPANVELSSRNQTRVDTYHRINTKWEVDSTETLTPEVHFSRSLHGKGLHQTLTYSIHIPPQLDIHEQCQLTIQDILTEDFYIDADQFSNLLRYEVLDVEKPAYFSKQYLYRLVYSLSQLVRIADGYQLTHPIHFRYQLPSEHEYAQVFIPESRKLIVNCETFSYNLKQRYNPNQLSAKIPVGLKASEKTVIFVTLVSTLCCALFINKTLRKRKFM